MKETLLLDTNAVIALFDGSSAVAELMKRAARILVPSVVYGELFAGAAGTSRRERQTREAVVRLLSKPAVEVWPITQTTGEFYSRVYNFLRERGTPIPTNDIWIAACTLEVGGVLCSHDAHLLSLPLVRVVDFESDV